MITTYMTATHRHLNIQNLHIECFQIYGTHAHT